MTMFPGLLLRLTVGAGVLLAALLLFAGKPWTGALAWTGVLWTCAVLTHAWLLKISPELVRERISPPSDRDRATRKLVALPFSLHLALAGLDARLGWSTVPPALQFTALTVLGLGFALVGWTLATNPFASSAVRIQSERDHRVIDTGPYALVRHPMYLATVLVSLSSGLALGSWWSALALLPVIGIFVRRTALEDQMLRTELPGYADYATQVRWRVIPLVF